jgi:hypothetical protein
MDLGCDYASRLDARGAFAGLRARVAPMAPGAKQGEASSSNNTGDLGQAASAAMTMPVAAAPAAVPAAAAPTLPGATRSKAGAPAAYREFSLALIPPVDN